MTVPTMKMWLVPARLQVPSSFATSVGTNEVKMVMPASEKASVITFSFGSDREVPAREAAGTVAVEEVAVRRRWDRTRRRDRSPTYFDSVSGWVQPPQVMLSTPSRSVSCEVVVEQDVEASGLAVEVPEVPAVAGAEGEGDPVLASPT